MRTATAASPEAAKEDRANDLTRKSLNLNRLKENMDRRRVFSSGKMGFGANGGDWGQKRLKKKNKKKTEKQLTFCRRGVISHCYNILIQNRYETN